MGIIDASHRVKMATIILIYSMIVTLLDGFSFFSVNEGIVITLIGFASTLLSIGIIKQHKSFKNDG